MISLYDRLTRATALVPGIHDVLPSFQRFMIGNVSKYYFQDTDQEVWKISKDFPNIAPVYDRMWMEYPMPQVINGDLGVLDYGNSLAGQNAITIVTEEPSDSMKQQGVRWILNLKAIQYIEVLGGQRVEQLKLLNQVIAIRVAEDGSPFSEDGDNIHFLPDPQFPAAPEDQMEMLWGIVTPALLALNLMHCKNVVVETYDPPKSSSKRDRRKSKPKFSFKVLRVIPMQRITKRNVPSDSGSNPKAFHRKRGHFKTFTEDAPLFGRHTGTWWWGPTMAGTLTLGEIDKVYQVEAPHERTEH